VSSPLIPYVEAPKIPLSFLQHVPILGDRIDASDPPAIHLFGVLVVTAISVGVLQSTQRAIERGLDPKPMNDFLFWVTAFGLVISHMFDALLYYPERVAANPLFLIQIWGGLSSYGGFLGAAVGAVAWRYYRKNPVMEYVDIAASVMPLAWVFGRLGCTFAHDHPGALSNAWFAVRFPAKHLAEGFEGRYDLGLIEMVLTIPLAAICWILWRRNPYRPIGFFIGLILACYAPVRFVLDFLRVAPGDPVFKGIVDPRYGGLTPAQWSCFVALAGGLWLLHWSRGKEYVRTAIPDPELDSEADEDDDDDEDDEPPSE
jgi:phosphatidylglycerol:prolipoprotein diacylglycerol transferase